MERSVVFHFHRSFPNWYVRPYLSLWFLVFELSFDGFSFKGLWSFDLIQLQTIQECLRDHPRRNRNQLYIFNVVTWTLTRLLS